MEKIGHIFISNRIMKANNTGLGVGRGQRPEALLPRGQDARQGQQESQLREGKQRPRARARAAG